MKPIFSPNTPDFLRTFWLPTSSPGAPDRTGNFARARRAALSALESSSLRFRRCTYALRAMPAFKPMCRHRARQCHGTSGPANRPFSPPGRGPSCSNLKIEPVPYVTQFRILFFVFCFDNACMDGKEAMDGLLLVVWTCWTACGRPT